MHICIRRNVNAVPVKPRRLSARVNLEQMFLGRIRVPRQSVSRPDGMHPLCAHSKVAKKKPIRSGFTRKLRKFAFFAEGKKNGAPREKRTGTFGRIGVLVTAMNSPHPGISAFCETGTRACSRAVDSTASLRYSP